jgi:hypothetical protein
MQHHTASQPRAIDKIAERTDNVIESVEASVKGEDRPMAKKYPTAPAALIWFSYPVGLIAVLLLALVALAVSG